MVKRRSFTAEFKARVVLEIISGSKTQAEVAREHRIKGQLDDRWADWFEGLTFTHESTELPSSMARSPTRPPYTACSTVLETWVYRSFRFNVLTLIEKGARR